MKAFSDFLSDDIVWYFPGKSAVSGVFRGKNEVLDHLGGGSKLGGSFDLTPMGFFGDDKYGIVIYHITSTRGGKTLREIWGHDVHNRSG